MAQTNNNVEDVMFSLGTIDNPTTSKITFHDVKEAILAKVWNSFNLLGKKLDYINLKDFLKYECE